MNASYKNSSKKIIAINEVSLFRQSRQTASLELRTNKKILLKKLIGDGVMISPCWQHSIQPIWYMDRYFP